MSQLTPPPPPPPPAAHGRPKRWQVVAAVVAIAAVIGGAAVAFALVNGHVTTPSRPTHAQPAASNSGITTEDQLIVEIQTQGLTPQRAEQLFALDVGPLPGVSVSGMKADGGFDGTDALLDLQQEWGSLPRAVQDAAKKLTTSAHFVSGPGLPPATASAIAPPASPASPPAQAVTARYVLTAYTVADYLTLAQAANAEESARLGVPPISAFVIEASNAISGAYADTTSFELQYIPKVEWVPWPDGCHITLYDLKMQGLAAEDAAAIVSHEVFHCYQQRTAGSNTAAASLHAWVAEGEATWVMEQLHPTNTVDDKAWTRYTFTPTTIYSDRKYDAVGVYGHQGDLAGDQGTIWPALLGMVTADVGGYDKPALALLLGSDSSRFYSTWGGSYYEDQTQTDWHMAGPGIPPTTGPTPRSVTIANGDAQEIGLFGAYQAAQTTIDATADIMVVNLTSGYGKAHDSGYMVDKTLDTTAPLALCLKQGGCKCPNGSPGASEHTIPATSPISVGLDGGDQSVAAYASGDSLSKFCKQPDQPLPPGGQPPPGGGGGGGGGGSEPEPPSRPAQSAGDPHLLTFDHHWYDLQAVGEFTLVKSTVDDFVVQTRTAPLPGSTTIAVNQAVATRLAGHRLTLTLQNETIIARVDGVVDSHEYFNVGTGTVQRLGTEVGAGYVVEWPDTTTMRVDQMGIAGLNVSISPAPSRAGQLVGLLGNDNGQASQDFVTANGVNLGATPPPATLHAQFADSWRLTQASSLFDYGAGQSTATFTNRTFPHAFVDASTVPNAARATQACQGEGITDQGILSDCVIDDAAINNQSVLTHYAQAQVVFTVASNLANHLPAFGAPAGGPSPTPTPAANGQGVLVDSGAVTIPGEDQAFSFPANAGDIIWIGSPGCDNGGLAFALVDPQGRTLYTNNAAQGLLCQGSRFALTTSGSYQLLANADKSRTGRYSVPIRFERHDQVFQTSYGQTISGSIPDAATHDVYVFTAQAGDVVHVFGAGCNVASFGFVQESSPIYLTLADSAGKSIIGLDCAQNSEYSIQGSATYEMVVNEPEHGPGSYQFVIQK